VKNHSEKKVEWRISAEIEKKNPLFVVFDEKIENKHKKLKKKDYLLKFENEQVVFLN
jgi:hypothetical protein